MTIRTHVFAVAIETYQEPSVPIVAYAENDAKKFVAAWQELGVDPADSVLLLSSQATMAALKSRLHKFLSKVESSERVVFFYAGHGLAFDGQSHITTSDTQLGDLPNTTLRLSDILSEFGQSKCAETLLFFDACHSGFLTASGVDSTCSEFAGEELLDFCQETNSRIAFASCNVNEFSHPSHSLKQGIWSHCITQSLTGHTKGALQKGQLITAASLQKHLREEVPRILRVTIASTVTQTPQIMGVAAKEFVIVDLAELLNQRQLATTTPNNLIKDSSLAGEIQGRVRELRGYKKPKQPLSSHSPWERSFVEQSGEAEVGEQATEIIDQIRESFRYKRKDLSFTNEGATASIKGPDFDVHVSLTQDRHDADKYVLKTEVASFRNPQVIDDPNFLEIFTRYCNKVVIELESGLDLAAKIDELEEIDALADHLEYDPECTEFMLRLPDSGIIIHATANRIIFSLDSYGDLKLLLDNTHKVVSRLAGASIILGLPTHS